MKSILSNPKSRAAKFWNTYIVIFLATFLAIFGMKNAASSSDLGSLCVSRLKELLDSSDSALSTRAVPKFEKNKEYYVLIKGVNSPQKLKFRGTKKSDENPHFAFTQSSDGSKFTVENSSLEAAVSAEEFNQIYVSKNMLLEEALNYHDAANLMVYPFKPLVTKGSVSVVGRILATRGLAERLSNDLAQFDNAISATGFRLPASTRVVLSDRPILPKLLGGPSARSLPIFNIRDGVKEATLQFEPYLYSSEATRNTGAVWHERAHTILRSTYSSKAFVNRRAAVQEALADFLSVHQSGKPEIGLNVLYKDRYVRNIDTSEARAHVSGPGTADARPRNNVLDLVTGSDHENSLLFSNALWRVREVLGKDRMDKLLKPLLDDLNLFYKSAKIPSSVFGAAQTAEEFKFFLASIRRTAESHGLSMEIAPLLDQIALNRRVDPEEIRAMSTKLVREGNFDFRRPPIGTSIYVHTMSGGMLALEGYLLYKILPSQTSEKK